MLKAQRRHSPPCKRSMWDQNYSKCGCAVVIRGTLRGRQVSISTAKYLPNHLARNLEAARDLALRWETAGKPVRFDEAEIIESTAPEPAPTLATIETAVRCYMDQARAVGNGAAQLGKKKLWFEKRLLPFAQEKGRRFVRELTLPLLKEWRSRWEVGDSVRQKIQEMVIGFLWECERNDWLPPNFAARTTTGLGKIKVRKTIVSYFPVDEYKKILDATYLYTDRPSIEKHNSFDRCGGDRIRAVTELMRWSGLRIRDAVTLERDRLQYNPENGRWSLMIYQRKTGEPVYCPLPPDVAHLLLSVPAGPKGNANDKYFFWSGNGAPKTVASNWERSYMKLFELANIQERGGTSKRCFPHMFRHTFAIENLLAGMPLEEVSRLLGHSSIKITEEHYAPWVRARQQNLDDMVVASWAKQGKPVAIGQRQKRVLRMPKVS